jgi:sec-independent protein translocase protein TatA
VESISLLVGKTGSASLILKYGGPVLGHRMALDPLELVIIGVIVVVFLLYGPKKIPELARALGMAKKEYSQASTENLPPRVGRESGDALVETARRLGIVTEGKTRDEISDEIVRRSKQ